MIQTLLRWTWLSLEKRMRRPKVGGAVDFTYCNSVTQLQVEGIVNEPHPDVIPLILEGQGQPLQTLLQRPPQRRGNQWRKWGLVAAHALALGRRRLQGA